MIRLNQRFVAGARRLLRSSLVLPIALLHAWGCAAEVGDADPEVALTEQPLFLESRDALWPNGIVPVCWDPATVARADFAVKSREVRDILNNTWPTVANIEFTGWGTCGAFGGGKVRITLKDGSLGGGSGQGYDPVIDTQMGLPVGHSMWYGSLIPHEFGHALGFHHEFSRTDFVDEPHDTCSGVKIAEGDKLNTAADRESIMVSTGYCQSNPNLSIWDAVGARNAYGPRVTQVTPLVTGYSAYGTDFATLATQDRILWAGLSSYVWRYAEGWVFTTQVPGTVPLKLYWHAGRGDSFLTATAAGEQAATQAGYAYWGIEGYVFSSAQEGTVPLKLYWNAARLDNMLAATAAGQQAAIAEGYTYVRTEAWLPATTPYSLIWTYWNSRRLDNLATKQNTQLAIDAANASYQFVGFDGAVWRFPFPGTTLLKNYWSYARADHFALATSASQSAAEAAGYVAVGSEDVVGEGSNDAYRGYVYTSAVNGYSPMDSYWRASREDHFTTISRASVATQFQYTRVRTEGWGLAIQP